MLAALRWTVDNVHSQFVLKVDEDTWVDPMGVVSWLMSNAVQSALFYGGALHGTPVHRQGKWAVSPDIYPAALYPLYAKGGGYVVSTLAASQIVQAIKLGQSPVLDNVEDATVGLAAAALQLTPTPIGGFRDGQEWSDALAKASAEELDEAVEKAVDDCCKVGTLLYHKPPHMPSCEACHSVQKTKAAALPLLITEGRSLARMAEFSPMWTPQITKQQPPAPPLPPLLPPLPPSPPSPPLPPLQAGSRYASSSVELISALGDASVDRIVLLAGTYEFTSTMCEGSALCIDRAVTIEAEVAGGVVLDAKETPGMRVISVLSGGAAELIGLNITGGRINSCGVDINSCGVDINSCGAGLLVSSGGLANMNACNIYKNKNNGGTVRAYICPRSTPR